jgi:hypothetical protein
MNIPLKKKLHYTFGTLKTLILHRKRIINPKESYYPEGPHKSDLEMAMDHLKYCMTYGHRLYEYYLYGLDVKGTNPLEYLSEEYNIEWLAAVHNQNAPEYIITVSDKNLFAEMMHDNHLPIPETVGLILNGNLRLEGNVSECVPFERLLEKECHLLCKPIRGYSGNGIISIRVKDGKLYHKGEEWSLEKLQESTKDDTYLVQHFVENQHPAMKTLFPNVLNTLRVTMARTESGVELLGVMCLMGSANSEYSNWHFGGICVSVDEEGKLLKYGFSNSDKRITKHPDTGTVFEGYQLPYYKETIDLCKKAMDVFYGLRTIGWDIAITEDGPIFIEGNHGWGVAAHQMVDHRGWMEKYKKFLMV